MSQNRNLKIGKMLALAAATLALSAGIFGIKNIVDATNETMMVETWRVIGFFTFSTLFFLLGTKLTQTYALWLVVISNKLILAIAGIAYGAKVNGALNSAIWDTILAVLLIGGYLLVRKSEPEK